MSSETSNDEMSEGTNRKTASTKFKNNSKKPTHRVRCVRREKAACSSAQLSDGESVQAPDEADGESVPWVRTWAGTAGDLAVAFRHLTLFGNLFRLL